MVWKIILLVFCCLYIKLAFADSLVLPKDPNRGYKDYERCNWLVTYRNHTYDLAPLTRKSLDRQLDDDIRSILRRVPTAAEHLNIVESNVRETHAHTLIATLGASTFLVLSLFHPQKEGRVAVNSIRLFSALLFAGGTYEAWRLTRESKTELNKSIDAFNKESPYPIEPKKTSEY